MIAPRSTLATLPPAPQRHNTVNSVPHPPSRKSKRRAPIRMHAPKASSPEVKPKSQDPLYRPKYAAFFAVNSFHFSGRSSSAKMADTGHTGTHAPQSMHSTGSIYSISSVAYLSESFLG